MNQGAANGATDLLSAVVRLGNSLLLVDLVVGAGSGIENVIVTVAVNLVRPTLSNGVNESAAGLSELRFEAGTRDLKFTDNIFAELIRDAGPADLLGEKCVVIVTAVDGVVVVISCHAVEADHSEVAICGRTRRQ